MLTHLKGAVSVLKSQYWTYKVNIIMQGNDIEKNPGPGPLNMTSVLIMKLSPRRSQTISS